MSIRVPTLTSSRLKTLLRAFRRTKILVVGDLMLDEFVWGKVSRISPEAPVPVVWVQSESVMPGGAANVANNVRALGGHVELVGVVGTDRWGEQLLAALRAQGIGTGGVMRDAARPTTVKTRVIAHHQQVVRVDREHNTHVRPATFARLLKHLRTRLAQVDAIIIEDYGKGVIARTLLETIIPLARTSRRLITVDPKEEHFNLYHRVTAITPNRTEAGGMVGRELNTERDVVQAGQELLQKLDTRAILMTLGEDGMCLCERGQPPVNIPTVAQAVFDVAGAGDTVIATFTLALASGATMREAAVLANHAAGIVVGKVGVASAMPRELLDRLDHAPTQLLKAQGSRLKARISSLQPRA